MPFITTGINFKCRVCGYSSNINQHDYKIDPIGSPLTKCPHCKNIYRNKNSKEWIQMSAIEKISAIFPLKYLSISIITALSIGLSGAFMELCNNFNIANQSFISILFVFGMIFWWVESYYIIVCVKVNRDKFIQRIAMSIARTQNSDYKELISLYGKIYNESFPKFVFVTKATRRRIEDLIKFYKTEKVIIPTFNESANASI